MKIGNTEVNIEEIDTASYPKTQKRLDSLTKPIGSLGRLEDLAKEVVAITGKERPSLKHKVIFTMAGDHGICDEGVSAFPKEVTPQMVMNFIQGGAAINVLAKHVGAKVVVVDMGVASDIKNAPGLVIRKIAYGTKNFAKGPAMSKEEAEKSVEAGIKLVMELPEVDILGTGDMGIGNTTPSAAITAVVTGKSVEEVTGRGTGVDDAGLKKKVAAIKKGIEVNRPDAKDGLDLLSKIGGFEIGGLAGVILGAGMRKVPVVVDGFISTAAAIIAVNIEPKVKGYIIPSHMSVEGGHKHALAYLGKKAIIDFDMRLGEGTGAALTMNIVEAGCKILNEMATFENAGVTNKE